MSDLQVVVPYFSAPWCLEDLLESMGDTDIPVLVVDNSPDSYCSRPRVPLPGNVEVVSRPENVGCTGAWNMGLARGADQTLIVSQWVRFAPTELPRRTGPWGLNHIAAGIRERANGYGLTFGDQGYHLMSVGRRLVDTVGTFDENLYAYGSDDEYVHRMDLAGVRLTIPDWGDWREHRAYSVAWGAHKRGAAPVDKARSDTASAYYDRKWGGRPGTYPTPFNDPNLTVKDWPPVC